MEEKNLFFEIVEEPNLYELLDQLLVEKELLRKENKLLIETIKLLSAHQGSYYHKDSFEFD